MGGGPERFRSGLVVAQVQSQAGATLFRHALQFSQADMLAADQPGAGGDSLCRVEYFPVQDKLVLRVANANGLPPAQFAESCARGRVRADPRRAERGGEAGA